MPTLPPIPQQSWDDHVQGQTDQAVSDGFAALDQARQAQDAARQAEQIATAREQEDATQRAQAQLTAVLQPARDAQATAVGTQQARDQLDQILAPARAAQQQAQQAAAAPTGPSGPASGPQDGTSAPLRANDTPLTDVGGTDWRAYAAQAAQRAGIDPALFQRQIQQESGFDPNARSGAGAQGIAQIVPSAHPGVNPLDPKASLDYAANWMRQLTDRYGGDARKALAAYNAGPGAVDKYGGVPPFEETQRYVRTIYDEGGQASPLEPPTTPGAQSSQYATARAPGRVEAVGQFEQGLPAEDAYSICGPVAALAFAQANGRNPDLAEARALAKQVGWTTTGGMNGVQNEQALLTRMGVKSNLDTNPDFGRIAQDAASGNPVIISTPVHYYYASGYNADTGKLFVGKTGTSRKGGGSWMTPQEIATLDGGINGALFVDNPQSPAPSVGASQPADGVTDAGDRPPSEFEQPSAFQGDRYLGRRPDQPITMGDVGEPTIATGLPRTPLEALDAGATAIEGQIRRTANERAADDAFATDYFRRVVRHEPTTPEEDARFADNPDYLAMTGEPLAAVNQAGRAALGLERAAATRQPGMSLETTGTPGGPVERLQSAVDAAAGIAGREVERLRLDKFPEEVRPTIQAAATDGEFWRTQRRGAIPDAQAEAMADRLGRSADEMIARGKAGAAYTTEETRALRNAVTSQAMRVNEINAQIAADPTAAPPRLVAEAVAEGMTLADLTRVAEGARAEAGRTFRAYRGFTRDSLANPGGAVERIFKAVGGPEQATRAVQEYQKLVADGADVFKLAQFWAQKEAPPVGFLDWYELVRRNSMLSGPRTLLVNALSGATEIPWKILGDAVDSSLRGRLRSEMTPELRAIWAGLRQGSEAAVQTLAHGITEEQALAGDVPRSISARVSNPLAKGAALALEAPMRGQQATDDVVRTIALRMHLAREAAQTANAAGLKGDAWSERVADLMQAPPPAMMKRADVAADDLTFKGEMGALGRALLGVQKVPLVGPALIPFLKTVYNITARGIDRSPLGLLGTGVDVARGVYRGGKELPTGVRPLSPRLRDNALGSAGSIWFYDQALRGNITGAGPDDPEKRRMLEAQGWQPYAVKLGGDYVSYTNWGPIAVPLALMAGAAEAQTYAKPGKGDVGSVVGDALQRSVKVLTEQNYLQGVGAIYKTMTDYQRYGHQWLTQYLSSLVPYGAAINTVGQATDPLVRQPEKNDVGQALAARFPTNPLFPARESVPAKQDVLGRDVVNEQQGLAAANPLRTREGRPDPTLTLLLANGADIGAPPAEVRGVPLAPADQRRHQEIAGGLIASTVEKIAVDPRFADLPPEIRTKILQGAIDRSRAAAGGILFGELGSQELTRRMREKAGATR